MGDTERIGEEWIEHDRQMDERRDRIRRAAWAYAGGVAFTLIAVAVKDRGFDAIDAWYISGAIGAAAMISKSVTK